MTLATLEVALFAFRLRNGSEMTRPLNPKNRRKWTIFLFRTYMVILVSYLRRPRDRGRNNSFIFLRFRVLGSASCCFIFYFVNDGAP